MREPLSDQTGLPTRLRRFANAYATLLYAFTSTRAASMTCLWRGPDHRVPCAGLVDDVHVIYGLGDLEREPSAAVMIKVSNIMSVLCMSYHRCTSRRRRRRHGQTLPWRSDRHGGRSWRRRTPRHGAGRCAMGASEGIACERGECASRSRDRFCICFVEVVGT